MLGQFLAGQHSGGLVGLHEAAWLGADGQDFGVVDFWIDRDVHGHWSRSHPHFSAPGAEPVAANRQMILAGRDVLEPEGAVRGGLRLAAEFIDRDRQIADGIAGQ